MEHASFKFNTPKLNSSDPQNPLSVPLYHSSHTSSNSLSHFWHFLLFPHHIYIFATSYWLFLWNSSWDLPLSLRSLSLLMFISLLPFISLNLRLPEELLYYHHLSPIYWLCSHPSLTYLKAFLGSHSHSKLYLASSIYNCGYSSSNALIQPPAKVLFLFAQKQLPRTFLLSSVHDNPNHWKYSFFSWISSPPSAISYETLILRVGLPGQSSG